jgi:hypothetical protein
MIAAVAALAFLLYQHRSANRLNVAPDAQRAIEKARQR